MTFLSSLFLARARTCSQMFQITGGELLVQYAVDAVVSAGTADRLIKSRHWNILICNGDAPVSVAALVSFESVSKTTCITFQSALQ
jgi:hypothetical protein